MKKILLSGILIIGFYCFCSAQVGFKVNADALVNGSMKFIVVDFQYAIFEWRPGFGIDGRVVFRKDKRLQIEAGGGYEFDAYSSKDDLKKALLDVAETVGISFSEEDKKELDKIPVKKFRIYNHYAMVPIQATFFLKNPNQGWFLLGGLTNNFSLASNEVKFEAGNRSAKVKEKNSNIIQRYKLISKAGMGYEIPIGKRGLSVSAYIEYQLNSKQINDRRYHQFGTGLLTSLRF